MKRHSLSLCLCLSLCLSLLTACGPSRYLSDGEQLLRHNRYEVLMEDGAQPPKEIVEALAGMRNYADQKPNPSFLGVRWGMIVYCLPSPTSTGSVAQYLHRKGSRPVVYNPSSPYRTAEQLQRLLESKGCFTSTVTFDTTMERSRDVTVTYHLRPSPRYRLGQVDYHCATPEVDLMLQRWKEDSPLRRGAYYDADLLSAERSRLTTLMRDSGFYLASRELFTVYLDTANEDSTLNLALLIDNPRTRDASGNVVAVPLRRHRIDRILFYPGATLASSDTLDYAYTLTNRTTGRSRTTHYLFLDSANLTLSPQVIARNMFLFHGQPYRDRNVEMTYNALLGLRNFKYVNIEFTPSPRSTADTALLDAHVRLIPAKRQRLALSFEVNNSSSMSDITTTNGNFGLEGTLTYQNKSLFRRHSGLLTLDLSSLIELPKDFRPTADGRRLAAFEFGTNATLDLPTLLVPFSGNLMWQRSRPHTLISLGGRYQQTSYLERTLLNLSYGFTWNRNRRSSHQLIPFELTYALVDADPDFVDRVTNGSTNARQVYQYKPHFILDARYTYTYSSQVFGKRQDFNYFTFTAESAGNLLWCLDQLVHFQQNVDSVSAPLGVPYSQHVRLSTELKRYFYHGDKSTFVSRLLLGVGLPYGNSRGMQMPYEKSFFGGGPTTLRAWHLRRLGPGNNPLGDTQIERTGDIQFVLNIEDRFPLVGPLEGALFLDAGNVWLLYPNESQPGGHLSLRGLMPSMAVGTGFGLRLNVSILTLRLDVGLPLYDPGYGQGARFRPPHWSEYARNLKDFSLGPATLNLGIDYPF